MAGATHNPVSFGAFAHSMLNGNLDEVNRYYDDDGQEVDLTDTFAGDDQSEAGSVDNETLFDTESEGCDDTSDYQDGANDQPNGSQDLVDHTLTTLENLTLLAQPVLNEQPLRTQTVLAHYATDLFKAYAEHGSRARLSAGILKFLQGGELIRAKGTAGKDPKKDRRLTVAPIVPARKGRYDDLEKDSTHETFSLPKTRDGTNITLGKREEKMRQGETPVTDDICNSQGPNVRTVQSNAEHRQFSNQSSQFQHRSVSNESWNSESTLTSQKAQTESAVVLSANTHITHCPSTESRTSSNFKPSLCFMQDPTAPTSDPPTHLDKIHASLKLYNHHKALEYQQPRSYPIPTIPHNSSTIPQHLPKAYLKHMYSLPSSYSLTTDPETHSSLPDMPFAPLGLTFGFRSKYYSGPYERTPKNQFPPGFVDALNRVFHLYNAQARFLLSYFTHRYAPGPALGIAEVDEQGWKVEPPHALFRLGITRYLDSRVEDVVLLTDDYGFGPEEKDFLRSVFEQVGVTEAGVRAVRGAWRVGDEGGRDGDDVDGEDEDGAGSLDPGNELSDEEYIAAWGFDVINGKLGDRATDVDGGDRGIWNGHGNGNGDVLDSFPRPPGRAPEAKRPSTIAEDLIAGRAYVETGLNVAEKEILARAVEADIDVIEEFWEDMRTKRRAWGALKGWCRMMEGRRVSIAKANGTW